jgi:uncharacterized protein
MIGRARACAAALAGVLLLVVGAAAEPTLPSLSGRVVDGARVLSSATAAQLTEILAAHERETSNQVVVATLPSLQGYEIEDFSVRLFRAWRLGAQDRNNGVLLLVAPNERRVRIEVGYGLEGALPDATAHAIITTEILPRFRAGDIEDGVVRGTRAILGAIVGTYKPRSGQAFDPQYDKLLVLLFGAFLMTLLYNIYYYYRYPTGRSRRYGGPWDSGWNSGGHWPGSGSGRGGGFGGGSSSGGFSGGGGSSGGGGASGRW